MRLRKHNYYTGNVQVSIKDPELKTIQRQRTLEIPTNLQREIADVAFALVEENRKGNPVRLLGISCSELVPASEAVAQTSLFDLEDKVDRIKQEKLEDAVASIRNKLGKDSIELGFRSTEGTGIRKKRN